MNEGLLLYYREVGIIVKNLIITYRGVNCLVPVVYRVFVNLKGKVCDIIEGSNDAFDFVVVFVTFSVRKQEI